MVLGVLGRVSNFTGVLPNFYVNLSGLSKVTSPRAQSSLSSEEGKVLHRFHTLGRDGTLQLLHLSSVPVTPGEGALLAL